MKNKYLLLSFFAGITLIMLDTAKVSSNVAAPQPGNTGDNSPANTCGRSGCHNVTPQTPAAGDITFNIGTGTPTTPLTAAFEYVPGTNYNLAFLINEAAGRYGFQVSVADAGLMQAGTLARTDLTNTSLATAFSRSYIGHKAASTFKNWVFKWTAPASGTGPVTFYYTYNLANADGTPNGDVIYKSSVTIEELTSGIEDIDSRVSDLNIFPNPVSNEFSMSFDLKNGSRVSSQIFSLDGKVSRELMNEKLSEGTFNRSFDIESMPAGIYLVKLNIDELSVTRKIMKL
jgi:hypothetical protein